MAASVRLSKAMELWEDAMRGDSLSPGTIKVRRSAMRMLIRVTGDLYVRSLTPRHIDQFFSTYSHWSPGTRNKNRLALSAFQNWAQTRGYMDRNVNLLKGRKRPSIPKRKHTFLTEEQLREMLDNCEDPRDRILIAMSFYLGLRTSEVTPIQWGDFREDFKRVRVRRSKKGVITEDDIPVRGNLVKEIKRWRIAICKHMSMARPRPDWYVISPKHTIAEREPNGWFRYGTTGYDPTRRLVQGAYTVVKTALASIGVTEKGEGTHTLRRSSAAIMRAKVDAMGGNGLRAVQLQLGHESQSTTEGYLDENRDRDLRDALIEALDDDSPEGEGSGVGAEIIRFPGAQVGT